MQDIFIIMKFTMKEMVRRKSFIISTAILLLLIIIGFNVPNIIKVIRGEDEKESLVIVDSQDIFEGKLTMLAQVDFGYEIQIANDLPYLDIYVITKNEELSKTCKCFLQYVIKKHHKTSLDV